MRHFDLFEFYRFMLAVLVGIYGIVRFGVFTWRWLGPAGRTRVGSALLHRYLVVLFLRMRFRQFAYELAVIGGLSVVLALLISAHWR